MRTIWLPVLAIFWLALGATIIPGGALAGDEFAPARARMVETLGALAALPEAGAPGRKLSPRILEAIAGWPMPTVRCPSVMARRFPNPISLP